MDPEDLWARIDGTRRRLTAVRVDADATGELDWPPHAADSTWLRTNQRAAGLQPGDTPSITVSSAPLPWTTNRTWRSSPAAAS